MEKWSIRTFKRSTRKVMKKDYWRMIGVCFIIAIFCGLYAGSVSLLNNSTPSSQAASSSDPAAVTQDGTQQETIDPYAVDTTSDLVMQIAQKVTNILPAVSEVSTFTAIVVSALINIVVPSNSLSTVLLRAISNMLSKEVTFGLAALILLVVLKVLYDVFIGNVLQVGEKRFFLETRTYHDTKIYRIFYPYQVGRTKNTAKVMLFRTIFQALWWLTIIGGVIKYYEYSMIPYLLAENPDIDRKTAFRMSKEMMRGNKGHAFCLDLSFFGWYFLSFITFGLTELFYVNPYVTGTWTELYMFLRNRQIENGGTGFELLNDIYLTERPAGVPESAQKGLIGGFAQAASEVVTGAENAARLVKSGASKVTRGVAADFTEAINAEKANAVREKANASSAQLRTTAEKDVYPYALAPVQPDERLKALEMRPINAGRHYAVTSYILLFFIFSMVGWIWEVSLHFYQTGEFANRGVLFGPWLPIYGTGGLIVLLLMRRWLNHPIRTFFLIMAVCSVVEYTSATILWENGHRKYWDYSTEILNLQGRICLKGAIAFGIGGMAFIYFLAPRIEDLFILKIPAQARLIICLILLGLFGADSIHSVFHPNTGAGITSMLTTSPDQAVSDTRLWLKNKFISSL